METSQLQDFEESFRSLSEDFQESLLFNMWKIMNVSLFYNFPRKDNSSTEFSTNSAWVLG